MLHTCAKRFDVTGNFEIFLMLHTCAKRFDVTGNFENFLGELNNALVKLFAEKKRHLRSLVLLVTHEYFYFERKWNGKRCGLVFSSRTRWVMDTWVISQKWRTKYWW